MEDLVVVKKYFNKHEALEAQSLLESNNISSSLSADDCGGYRPHLTLGMGNFMLLVNAQDVEKAKDVLAILEQDVPEAELEKAFQAPLAPAGAKDDDQDFALRMRRYLKVSLLIAAIIFVAVFLHKEFKSTIHKEYYLNHMLMRETTIRHHVPNGPVKAHYDDGVLSWEAYYKDGKLNGPFHFYQRTGKLAAEGFYKDGQMDGIYKGYDEDGRLSSQCLYSNHGLNGECKLYYDNGEIKHSYAFKDGKRLDEEGKLFSGEEKVFSKEGQMLSECYYKDGLLQGEFNVYYKNGSLESVTLYKDGMKNGLQKTFFHNGQIETEKQFANDKLIAAKIYNKNGYLTYKKDKTETR